MLKDTLLAFNTDGSGCVSFLERTGFVFSKTSVVVCGTGPTALAIVHACALAGAREVILVGRNKDRAQRVLSAYVDRFDTLSSATFDFSLGNQDDRSFRESYEKTVFKFGSYATSTQAIAAADLVVNATTLGMHLGDPAPFDVALLHKEQTVFDVVYGHGETALLSAARAVHATAHDGSGMLVAQAVESAKIVFDVASAQVNYDEYDLFAIMAEAAGFSFPFA